MLTKDSNSYVSNEKQINYYVVSFQDVNSHFAGHSLHLKRFSRHSCYLVCLKISLQLGLR